MEPQGRLKGIKHVHLVGIGGIGMSGIARILIEEGYTISGSDMALSPLTVALEKMGARVYQGHRKENLAGAELVVASSAIPADNPEIEEARRRGLPVLDRAQILGQLTEGQYGIATAGTHGKTTTSAMIALILERAGLDPTILVGGIIPELGSNAKKGSGRYFVLEADEYRHTFLGLSPSIAVVTNIEMDHPDCFADTEDMYRAFRDFVNLVPKNGLIVLCSDDPLARHLSTETLRARVITYGMNDGACWRAVNLHFSPEGNRFQILAEGRLLSEFSLCIPGEHNVKNALAASVVAKHLGIDLAVAREALSRFGGVARRFEVKGQAKGIVVIDDYAHHPSEIKATLAAARERYPKRRLWVVFQPHTYSRTKALMEEFATSLQGGDRVIVTEIYPAREVDTLGTSSRQLVKAMQHPHALHAKDLEAATQEACQGLEPGDVLLVLGAGDVWRVAEEVLARLK